MKKFRESIKENLSVLRGNLGVLAFTGSLLAAAGWGLTGPFFSLYILGLGGSYFDIGLVSAVGSLCNIAPILLAGHLADVVGRRKLFVTMNFILSFSSLIMALAPSWPFILVGHAFESLFLGFRGPAFSALVADSTKPKRRALAYALMRIPSTSAMASPYIAGFFIDKYDVVTAMRWFYALAFIVSLVASTIRYKFIKETLREASSSGNGVLNGLKSSLMFLVKPERRVPRQVFVILAVSIILNLGSAVTGNYWITYAVKDVIGLTATEWGFITLVQIGIVTLFAIISAVISDKYGRVKLIALSLILTPVTVALFPYCQDFHQVLTLLAIQSVLGGLSVASFSAILIDYSPRGYRGRIEANLILLSNVSGIVGSLWGGYIYQNYSKALPFTVNALITGMPAALFILKVKEPTEREE